jgi:hypothetical protein
MPADTPTHLAIAARQRHELARAKAIKALHELDRAAAPVTFQAVAAAAGVSRSWLYSQPDIRSHVEKLRRVTLRSPTPAVPTRQRPSETSLRARLNVALQRNQVLSTENQRLRQELAAALGQRRATEATGYQHGGDR